MLQKHPQNLEALLPEPDLDAALAQFAGTKVGYHMMSETNTSKSEDSW